MPLIKCPECNTEVSDSASTCPSCGYPIKQFAKQTKQKELTKRMNGFALNILLAMGIIFLPFIFAWFTLSKKYPRYITVISMIWCASFLLVFAIDTYQSIADPEGYAARQAEQAQIQKERREAYETKQKAENEQCRKDIDCWSENHRKLAWNCNRLIEQNSQYDYEWGGVLSGGLRYPYSKWLNEPEGSISYFGDNIKFQNGFGVWINMIYRCDIATPSGDVLNVKVEAGKL